MLWVNLTLWIENNAQKEEFATLLWTVTQHQDAFKLNKSVDHKLELSFLMSAHQEWDAWIKVKETLNLSVLQNATLLTTFVKVTLVEKDIAMFKKEKA